ncbi:mechanosensitive ion channel family protein [Coralloluteibacterium thermophilus]|uniref:Mechanosensitive ion channel family protein n=1 Tax=Coralloluteibacterium thermophilum TaxID=2707049 RepID=A0ABV9NQ67_9GAMM
MPEIDWSTLFAAAWPLFVALLIGFLVRRLLLSIARRAGHLRKTWALIVAAITVPAAWALPLVFLSQAVVATPLPEAWIARIQHLLAVGVLACVTWAIVRAIGALETMVLLRNRVDVVDNLQARRVHTQARVLSRSIQTAVIVLGVAVILMTFPAIRQVGQAMLASAGLAGIVVGFAARPVFGNLIAGLQIALTQPIRLDDVVIVDGEWGRIDEITSAYVVVRIWDERRLIVPLQWFIENPFQNWTRSSAQLLGTAFLWLDYRTPMDAVRDELRRICESDARWDGRVCVAQVTETDKHTMEVRLLVSARNSGDAFDLRCAVRERMIDFLRRNHPEALPRLRADVVGGEEGRDREAPASQEPPQRKPTEAETRSPAPEDVNPHEQAERREQLRRSKAGEPQAAGRATSARDP